MSQDVAFQKQNKHELLPVNNTTITLKENLNFLEHQITDKNKINLKLDHTSDRVDKGETKGEPTSKAEGSPNLISFAALKFDQGEQLNNGNGTQITLKNPFFKNASAFPESNKLSLRKQDGELSVGIVQDFGSSIQVLDEETINLSMKLSNISELKGLYLEWKKKRMSSLSKKVNKIYKYFSKIINVMIEKDNMFGAQFLEPMKIAKEQWETKTIQEKIQAFLLPFDKMLMILRYHALIKLYSEKIYRKLIILHRKYLKTLFTFKTHFGLQLEKFLHESYESRNRAVNVFKEQLQIYGFNKFEMEERIKMKRMREHFDFLEDEKSSRKSSGAVKAKFDSKSRTFNRKTESSQNDVLRQKVNKNITKLNERYEDQLKDIFENEDNQLELNLEVLWKDNEGDVVMEEEHLEQEIFENKFNVQDSSARIIQRWAVQFLQKKQRLKQQTPMITEIKMHMVDDLMKENEDSFFIPPLIQESASKWNRTNSLKNNKKETLEDFFGMEQIQDENSMSRKSSIHNTPMKKMKSFSLLKIKQQLIFNARTFGINENKKKEEKLVVVKGVHPFFKAAMEEEDQKEQPESPPHTIVAEHKTPLPFHLDSLDKMRKNHHNFFVEKDVELKIIPKMIPFFHNKLFEESSDFTYKEFKKSKTKDLLSLKNSKMQVQMKIFLFSETKNICGYDILKEKLVKLHKKNLTIYPMVYLDIDSAVKTIVWLRISFKMKKSDHSKFVKEILEKEAAERSYKLKVHFKNQLNVKARVDFNSTVQNMNIRPLEIQYLQNYTLFNEHQQKMKIKELNKHMQYLKILKDSSLIFEEAIAMKSYITYISLTDVELRLDFKFPTASLSSFSIGLSNIKLV